MHTIFKFQTPIMLVENNVYLGSICAAFGVLTNIFFKVPHNLLHASIQAIVTGSLAALAGLVTKEVYLFIKKKIKRNNEPK